MSRSSPLMFCSRLRKVLILSLWLPFWFYFGRPWVEIICVDFSKRVWCIGHKWFLVRGHAFKLVSRWNTLLHKRLLVFLHKRSAFICSEAGTLAFVPWSWLFDLAGFRPPIQSVRFLLCFCLLDNGVLDNHIENFVNFESNSWRLVENSLHSKESDWKVK